jgi:hypothetical protein
MIVSDLSGVEIPVRIRYRRAAHILETVTHTLAHVRQVPADGTLIHYGPGNALCNGWEVLLLRMGGERERERERGG